VYRLTDFGRGLLGALCIPVVVGATAILSGHRHACEQHAQGIFSWLLLVTTIPPSYNLSAFVVYHLGILFGRAPCCQILPPTEEVIR